MGSTKFNPEDDLPDDWESTLESRLDRMLYTQLEAERERSRNNICIAHWNNALKVSEVVVVKGMHMITIGQPNGPSFFLNAEETLFMVDKGRLALYFKNQSHILSLRECYTLLTSVSGVPLSWYLVYSHLKSLGNIIFRHGLITSINPDENPQETRNEVIEDDDSDKDIFDDQKVRIAYDVWLPQSGSKWSRKNATLPSFHLVLLDKNDKFDETVMLSQVYNIFQASKVPIKLALVELGIISFFDILSPIHPT